MKKQLRKPTKTISGVTPLAVMLPPRPCPHGTCTYCPTYNNNSQSELQAKRTSSEANYKRSELQAKRTTLAPQSYTPQSPAVLRAIECNYDPKKQIKVRLKSFKAMNHPTEKIELIIMGGTFLSYPKKFKTDFIKKCYDALNGKISKNLSQAKKTNEKAKHRVTALCIETRPDFCSDKHIKEILNYGATRVELGVQAIDDKIYKKVNRGHNVQDVINATKKLKEAGFKIGYHIMPGIPGSNPKKDIKMFKKIFSSQNFKPDQIKLYPCQVLKGAQLENTYYQGEYIPYTKTQTEEILTKMLKLTPRYCRIMRIMREIPPLYLIAGIKNIDTRKNIEDKIRKNKTKISEIRFREIGFAQKQNKETDNKIKITKYKASKGTEYFIEVINKNDILFGLCRLRLPNTKSRIPNPNSRIATIRELHIYGPAVNLNQKPKTKNQIQHSGLGIRLLEVAEKIAQKKGYKKLRIISGVGVREYYKKSGYKLDKQKIYMAKSF